MTNSIIDIKDLTKIFQLKGQAKEIRALNDVNLSIKEGEIFGLLGPNGAGKTTLIQILTTLMQPTSGSVNIDGFNILKNPKQAKAKISLMLDNKMLYHRVTAYDNLKFFCKIYKVSDYKSKINEMVKEFGLEKWLNQYVEAFSSGMKMKLALCRTLLLERKILVLDEPTLGLDVKTVAFMIEKLKETNRTIFLTSHDMNVVEQLCNRVAFINKGNILKIGTKEDIQSLEQSEIRITVKINNNITQLIDELNSQNNIIELVKGKDSIDIILKSRKYYKNLLLILGKYDVMKIQEKELSLTDIFLRVI